MLQLPPLRRRSAALLVALLAAGLAGGCKANLGDVTGSIGASQTSLPSDPAALRARTEQLGRAYERKPADAAAAMAYARALRAQDQNAQAVAVLQGALTKNENNLELVGAYGKALADIGRFEEAQAALARAHTPERPNWSILSTQGAVADQMGDHARAQNFYHTALKIMPGEPSVLSNLGLSYALSRDLTQAEAALRQAAGHPRADARVRQNLALVLALQGKYQEAESVQSRDLPPAEAAENVATIRRTIAESDTWRKIQQVGQPGAARKAAGRTG